MGGTFCYLCQFAGSDDWRALDRQQSKQQAINDALGVAGSEINRSEDEKYQYFKSGYTADEYAKLQKDYLDVCEQIEGEGLVLLKNENNALPLADSEKVSCFLTGSVSFNYATSGSSGADTKGYTDFKTALENAELSVNEELWNFYRGKWKRDTAGISKARCMSSTKCPMTSMRTT